MASIHSSLTVFFEDPFWVGVFERRERGAVSAARVVFGPEPKDGEVYEWFLAHWQELRFSPSVPAGPSTESRRQNPKRIAREIRDTLSRRGTGTKSQEALSRLREKTKQQRRTVRKQERELESKRKFQLLQQKKKEKHRGR